MSADDNSGTAVAAAKVAAADGKAAPKTEKYENKWKKLWESEVDPGGGAKKVIRVQALTEEGSGWIGVDVRWFSKGKTKSTYSRKGIRFDMDVAPLVIEAIKAAMESQGK